MFIFDDEVKDEARKQVFDHPLGGKVRFMKYGKRLYANVKDYFEPFKDDKIENIKKVIPKKWHDHLEKVWVDVEAFNKASMNLTKNIPGAPVEPPAGEQKTKESVKNGRNNKKKNTRRSRRRNRRHKIRKD